jgi:hypothetical protein
MIITRENGKFEIMITKEEYVAIAEMENKDLLPEFKYDIDEIKNMELDSITITENMLDECEEGFYMWSDTFWEIIRDCTPESETKDFEIRVNL